MNFKFKDIIFLIVLIYKLNIVCATIQTLPCEIIQKVLMFNDFDLDDYHSKIPIANTLNKNNFFQDSPCQIIAYLFKIAKPNLMLTCKQFDRSIKKDIKNEIPSQQKLYINFLIENQSIFNFNKKIVLKNLALLFFNVHNKKIDQSYNNDLKFYEPLAFALTFKKYNRNHLVENRHNIQQYQKFFNNVLWFNQNLTIYYLSEPEKLFLIGYFSNHLSIEFFDNHKPIFEKLLKTEERTKDFLHIIQSSIKERYHNRLIEMLFYKNRYIEPNQNTIQIIKFFTLNNIHPHHHYEYQEYIDSKTRSYKNTLKTIELSSCYKSNCNDCLKNKKSLIAFFFGQIIKFLIKQEHNCNHTTFENQNIKNWIQKTFPRADYEKFINIISFLKQIKFINFKYSFEYLHLLDKNKSIFKNMVKLRNFCQKHNHLLKAIAHFEQNPVIWRDNYYLKHGFADNVLSQIKCYCYNCNKNRLYTTLYYILLFTASSILIFCIFFITCLESLKNE